MDFNERMNGRTVNKTQNLMCKLKYVNIFFLQLENTMTYKHQAVFPYHTK